MPIGLLSQLEGLWETKCGQALGGISHKDTWKAGEDAKVGLHVAVHFTHAPHTHTHTTYIHTQMHAHACVHTHTHTHMHAHTHARTP